MFKDNIPNYYADLTRSGMYMFKPNILSISSPALYDLDLRTVD